MVSIGTEECWEIAYLDELELHILWQLVKRLHNAEYRDYDVDRRVPLMPEFAQLLHRAVDVTHLTRSDDGLYSYRVGLVADLEDVLRTNKSEASMCRL